MINLDRQDKLLLNELQGGFPLVSRPYRQVGQRLGLGEAEVIERLRRLLAAGGLTRLGPILNASRLGGERTLAAMHVPPERLDEVAAKVNAHPDVTHNYERAHYYNLWFVISSENPAAVERTIAAIQRETGLEVVSLPALDEYYIRFTYEFPVDPRADDQ